MRTNPSVQSFSRTFIHRRSLLLATHYIYLEHGGFFSHVHTKKCFVSSRTRGSESIGYPNENTHQVNMFVQAILQGCYSLIGVYHFTENETETWVTENLVSFLYHFAENKNV